MATYNGARFLSEQLDSIACQTRPPDELVISDDGSSDDTTALVARFAARAPFPVRVLDKTGRLGFADNFLHAAAACRGEVVAFSDQDDVWLPRKLEIGLGRLITDDSLLSLHPLTVTDEALRPVSVHAQGIAGDAVFAPLSIDPRAGWGNTMMFRRELVTLIPRDRRPRHPGMERPLSHDTWLYLLAAALGRVSHIAEPLILYRQHGANAAGVTAPSRTGRVRAILAPPTLRYAEEIALTDAMAALLGGLAVERPDLEAAHAARRFTERSRYLEQRRVTYEASSAVERVRALWRGTRLQARDPALDPSRRRRAFAKDLALGVTGLSRRLSR